MSTKAAVLYRDEPVEDFINEYNERMQQDPEWQRLREAPEMARKGYEDGELLTELTNTVLAKLILSHIFGEDIARLYKKWYVRNFPCEEELEYKRSPKITWSEPAEEYKEAA